MKDVSFTELKTLIYITLNLFFYLVCKNPNQAEKKASGTAMCSQQCMLGDLTFSDGKGSSNFLYTRT